MGIKLNTTNQPEGSEPYEVDEHEYADLVRLGIVAKGKGDIDEQGNVKPKVAKEAFTGQIPQLTQPSA